MEWRLRRPPAFWVLRWDENTDTSRTLCTKMQQLCLSESRKDLSLQRDPSPDRPVDRPATAQRIPVQRFPRYLLRDRDAIFGQDFRKHLPDKRDAAIDSAFALATSLHRAGDWIFCYGEQKSHFVAIAVM